MSGADHLPKLKNSEPEGPLFDIAHIMEHMVYLAMTEVTPTLQYFLHNMELKAEIFDSTYRAELVCRGLTGRISAMAEIYGQEDAATRLRTATYSIKQFFAALTDQMNDTHGHKTRGDITFVLTQASEEFVCFDARRICMIVYHLVSNALQHGRTENKNIEIRCHTAAQRFEMSVRDYGGGVPKELQPGMFMRFTEEFSLKNQQLGLFPPQVKGLGLPLCRKLAEDMGGELNFRNYGAGAQFTVCIPQGTGTLHETAVYQPDLVLLKRCMADLLLELSIKSEH